MRLALILSLLTSFFCSGCGKDSPPSPVAPGNSQPLVEEISDMMLEFGDSTTLSVGIKDEDEGDRHTITATCEDPDIAMASAEDETITISARDGGETTCTVYVTDSSGQSNAKSENITFKITVPRNSQPLVEEISDMMLEFGDSTTLSVGIKDEDEGDRHTITATCEDPDIAMASAEDETITISARDGGETTCTVYVTDSSGQSNAKSENITFKITVPRNSQPLVEEISDMMLEFGDSTTLSVGIKDEDEGDRHTITATCEDPDIAMASAEDETITISARDGGETTCTVYVTDSSGQSNAKSENITFKITVPRNSQPLVEEIFDMMLEFGDSTTLSVGIKDEDEGDRHTITATCEDPDIAMASTEDETITISAGDVGETTCTVYVTDSSGQSNAQSENVTFKITVQEPPPVHLGDCQVGMKLQAKESCDYYSDGYTVRFSVSVDGSSCRASKKTVIREVLGVKVEVKIDVFCVSHDIEGDDVYDEPDFSADNNSDGSWTIKAIP